MLVKGSRFMRMERVVERFVNGEPQPRTGRTLDMLLLLTQWLAQDVRTFNVFSYITLRAVLGDADRARASRSSSGPTMIRKLTAYKIGQAVRDDGPQTPSHQGRHADHGRRADPGVDRRHHAPVGRPDQPLRLGGARGDAGLRRRSAGSTTTARSCIATQGLVGARQVLLAVGARAGGGVLPRLQRELPAQTELIVPFFKQVAYPLGVVGFVDR